MERYVRPVTALVGTSDASLLQLMHEHVIHQIPLLNPDQRVVDLVDAG